MSKEPSLFEEMNKISEQFSLAFKPIGDSMQKALTANLIAWPRPRRDWRNDEHSI